MALRMRTGTVQVEGLTDAVSFTGRPPFLSVRTADTEEWGGSRPAVVAMAAVVGIVGGFIGLVAAPFVILGALTLPIWSHFPGIRDHMKLRVSWQSKDVTDAFTGVKRVALETGLGLAAAVVATVTLVPLSIFAIVSSAALLFVGTPIAAAQSTGHAYAEHRRAKAAARTTPVTVAGPWAAAEMAEPAAPQARIELAGRAAPAVSQRSVVTAAPRPPADLGLD